MTDGDSKSPVLSIVAMVAAGIAWITPIILISLPILVSTICGVIAIVRKERPRWLAPIAIGLCILVYTAAGQTMRAARGDNPDNLAAAEILDWGWEADPEFTTQGAIKWRVSIKNKTDKPIESVQVEFTSFDQANHMLTTKNIYVTAIPPGGVRNEQSFADYYGTESTANIQITSVKFSD